MMLLVCVTLLATSSAFQLGRTIPRIAKSSLSMTATVVPTEAALAAVRNLTYVSLSSSNADISSRLQEILAVWPLMLFQR